MTLWIKLASDNDDGWAEFLSADEADARPAAPPADGHNSRQPAIVIVPVNKVAWFNISLPAKFSRTAKSKLLAYIKGSIEGQILDEVDDIHLAIEPKGLYRHQTEGSLWVGICNKTWLKAQLKRLNEQKIIVSKIIPEFYPAADSTQQSYWLKNINHQPHLVYCLTEGVFIQPLLPETEFSPLFDIAQQQIFNQTDLQPANLQSYSLVNISTAALLDNYRNPSWNFAQFDFRQNNLSHYLDDGYAKLKQFASQRQWRPLRIGLISLLAISLIGLNALALVTARQTAALKQQLQTNFTQAFPKTPLVLEPFAMMKRELKLLRQAHAAISADDFSVMAKLLPLVLPTTVKVKQLEFNNNQLTVYSDELNNKNFAAIKTKLRNYGYSAKLVKKTLIIKVNHD